MDGLFPFVLLAVPSQSMLDSLTDLGILAATFALALFSALALVRQLLFALLSGE